MLGVARPHIVELLAVEAQLGLPIENLEILRVGPWHMHDRQSISGSSQDWAGGRQWMADVQRFDPVEGRGLPLAAGVARSERKEVERLGPDRHPAANCF